MSADIAFLSIAELGHRYRDRTLSPEAVAQVCLGRIARAEPGLNAIATLLADAALSAAKAAEEELGRGIDRGPLHGVPVMVKDLFAMAGEPTRFGSHASFTEWPDHDAAVVARLRAAGAVILAKTNLLEFADGAVHPDVGQTNNPHDLARTSGGSSGGSAAAVAAGLCYAAVGTDTGGSIRIPASYCGIVGLKPSYDLVSLDGCQPLSWSLDHAGPLARTAADAATLLGAMIGDPTPMPGVELRGLRLGVIAAQLDATCVTADVAAAIAAGLDRLRAAGVVLVPVEVAELDAASAGLMTVLGPEAALVHAERLAFAADRFGATTRRQLEAGLPIRAVDYLRGLRLRDRLRAAFATLFTQVDALASAAVPYPAPFEDPPMDGDEPSDEGLFSGPANLSGCPSASLPCGASPTGLPIGMQVTAALGRDFWLLGLAAAMRPALGGFVRPPEPA